MSEFLCRQKTRVSQFLGWRRNTFQCGQLCRLDCVFGRVAKTDTQWNFFCCLTPMYTRTVRIQRRFRSLRVVKNIGNLENPNTVSYNKCSIICRKQCKSNFFGLNFQFFPKSSPAQQVLGRQVAQLSFVANADTYRLAAVQKISALPS